MSEQEHVSQEEQASREGDRKDTPAEDQTRGDGTAVGSRPGGVHPSEADTPGGAVSGEIGKGEAVSGGGDLGGGADIDSQEER